MVIGATNTEAFGDCKAPCVTSKREHWLYTLEGVNTSVTPLMANL